MKQTNRTITIVISPDGRTKVETYGYTGPACQNASKFIEEALGQKTAEQFKTPYFLNETNQHHLEINQ